MHGKRLFMKFKMIHENYNVADLDKSIAFYEKALGLKTKAKEKGVSILDSILVGIEEDELRRFLETLGKLTLNMEDSDSKR